MVLIDLPHFRMLWRLPLTRGPASSVSQLPDDDKAMRRLILGRLHAFPLPTPLTEQTFCDTLAALRGRPIRLWPMPMARIAAARGDASEAPSGLWLADDHVDNILFEQDTSISHRRLIIYHEGAHILWDDEPQVIAGQFAPSPYCNLDLSRMRTVMARQAYNDPYERRAELTARELLLRADSVNNRGDRQGPSMALAQRLAADLDW